MLSPMDSRYRAGEVPESVVHSLGGGIGVFTLVLEG